MNTYIVVEKWIASYENPITLKNGDRVCIDLSVKEPDSEWANWVWCTSATYKTGWVPIQILKVLESNSDNLQTAIVTEDYSAHELTINKGDIVVGNTTINGWLWCRKANAAQYGWVPIRNIKPI